MAKKLAQGHQARLAKLMEDEDHTMDTICTHVAQGGSVIDLCELWDVVYGKVVNWINADEKRSDLYKQALNDRTEWAKESVLNQIRQIANADVRALFDEDGNLLPPEKWDADVAKAVAGVDVSDIKEGKELVGYLKKIKMNDKLRAIELFGKTVAMFKDEVNHTLTLADLVAMSNKPPETK